jgi:hypothetical protein
VDLVFHGPLAVPHEHAHLLFAGKYKDHTAVPRRQRSCSVP